MLSGCGLVSGLDKLQVDASTDATAVEAGDDGATIDAPVVANEGGVDGAGIGCVKIHCDPGTICCAYQANGGFGYECATSCEGGVALGCDDKSDCTNAAEPFCCFANGAARCGSLGSTCATQLCNDPSQCSNNAKCEPFDAGYGVTLSKCQ
jgi:hypothetical protein